MLHVAVIGAAAVLMYAGCAKLASVSSVTPTVRALGVSPSAAGPTVVGIASAEISCAVLLLVDHAVMAAVTLTALASVFAAAAAFALRASEPIACACFGRGRSTTLGMRQIAMLAVWLPIAGVVVMLDDPTPTQGSLLANAVAAAVALLSLRQVVPIARRSRALRMALGPVS
jgi:hypothetical protein